jgi:hypothetical protein
VAIAALSLSASATASGSLKSCGSKPAQLTFNLQVRGVACRAAFKLASHGASGPTKRAGKHVFRFHNKGWTCLYTVFHSTHAQDSEGEIFDCRMKPHAVARWSDSSEIEPHSLR